VVQLGRSKSCVQMLTHPLRQMIHDCERPNVDASMLDCIVRNATNTGARVQIANTVELPDPVGLTLDGGYRVRRCRVVWRTLTETGVEFLKTGVDSARS
ncbi:MAG: hypothetical protein WCF56_17455, partial [Pseudolabrys sp.]